MTHYEPGDVIEIQTRHGARYLQVTHKLPGLPEVIRLLPAGAGDADEADWQALAASPGIRTLMMPIRQAIERGDLSGRHLGNADVPAAEGAFPTFRIPVRDRHGDVVYWWLWDGRGLTCDIDESVDLESLPVREVTSAPSLLRLLEDPEPAHRV